MYPAAAFPQALDCLWHFAGFSQAFPQTTSTESSPETTSKVAAAHVAATTSAATPAATTQATATVSDDTANSTSSDNTALYAVLRVIGTGVTPFGYTNQKVLLNALGQVISYVDFSDISIMDVNSVYSTRRSRSLLSFDEQLVSQRHTHAQPHAWRHVQA